MRRNGVTISQLSTFLAGSTAVFFMLVLSGGTAGAAETGSCAKKKASARPAATSAAKPEAAKPPAETPAETAGQAGMKAYIDPATGKLREPTAEDAAAAAAAAAKSRQAQAARPEPVVIQHASGMVSAELGEEYMEDVVVRKNADGTLAFQCVPRSRIDKVLTKPGSPAKPELEKE